MVQRGFCAGLQPGLFFGNCVQYRTYSVDAASAAAGGGGGGWGALAVLVRNVRPPADEIGEKNVERNRAPSVGVMERFSCLLLNAFIVGTLPQPVPFSLLLWRRSRPQ